MFVEETNRPFVDVSPQAWYGPAVGDLYQKNLIQGVTSDRFAPDRPAQRAEVVTLLYRMAGEPAVTGPSGFVDVPADAWYASAVRWAEEKGIAQGSGRRILAPTQAVTRQEMAVFLYRYGQEAGYDVSGQASLSRYADRGAVAPWAPGSGPMGRGRGHPAGHGLGHLGPQRDGGPGPNGRAGGPFPAEIFLCCVKTCRLCAGAHRAAHITAWNAQDLLL